MASVTTDTAAELEQLVSTVEPQLRAIADSDAAAPRAPGKWSRKQVLGHLIDSAANNHQRFVRLRTVQHIDLPGYEQNAWVDANGYAGRAWSAIVDLWSAYNRQLAEVMRRLPASSLQNTWTAPEGKQVTLEWIMTDYLTHMRHHIDQILPPA
jgi:hypothetical protein